MDVDSTGGGTPRAGLFSGTSIFGDQFRRSTAAAEQSGRVDPGGAAAAASWKGAKEARVKAESHETENAEEEEITSGEMMQWVGWCQAPLAYQLPKAPIQRLAFLQDLMASKDIRMWRSTAMHRLQMNEEEAAGLATRVAAFNAVIAAAPF
jgi:hypothetical protein